MSGSSCCRGSQGAQAEVNGLSPLMAEALKGVTRRNGFPKDTVQGARTVAKAKKAGKATSGGGKAAEQEKAKPSGLAAAERLSAIQHEQHRDSSATVRCGTLARHGTLTWGPNSMLGSVVCMQTESADATAFILLQVHDVERNGR